jgi:hypothetical protein
MKGIILPLQCAVESPEFEFEVISNLKFQIAASLALLGEANDVNAMEATSGNSNIPGGSAFVARVRRRRSKRAKRGIVQGAPFPSSH